MAANENPQDPLAFMKRMWSSMGITLPGMILPTMDPDELEKRIKDLRAVEGWLRMNLNMLSASINTLEVQRATLATLKSFAQSARDASAAGSAAAGTAATPAAGTAAGTASASPGAAQDAAAGATAGETSDQNANPFVNPSMWPWNLMQQVGEQPAAPEPPRKPEASGS